MSDTLIENSDNLVSSFSSIISDIADPLFSKTSRFINGFGDKYHRDEKKWFGQQCREARSKYLSALHIFNNDRSPINRLSLAAERKAYKKLIRSKQRRFKFHQIREFENLRNSNPRQFWKYFKKSTKSVDSRISLGDFKDYFSEMFENIASFKSDSAEQFCATNDFDNSDPTYAELDRPITYAEVVNSIKSLKRNKACGSDRLLNEYFIESCDILAGHITEIFNIILNLGVFPEIWTKGITVPLHKKGLKNRCK